MLIPWKESYDQLRQHIKKQRHYFINKGPSSEGYCFSSSHVWMWELDIKKAEHQRIDAFELWSWRRLLRVPWTARRSNQSILKEISSGCSLKGLMLKLKLQYFGHLMQRADSFEKTLMLGKIEGRKRRGQQRMRWLDGITDLMDMGLGGLRELVMSSNSLSHLLSSPPPPPFNLSQHQGLFQWVSSSQQVAKILELQLQHQSFQWIFRTDFL